MTFRILFTAAALSGCAIYDNDCPEGVERGSLDTAASDVDDIDQPGQADPEFWLEPGVVAAGDTTILSLRSDEALQFDAVLAVEFFGDVTVCTSQAREDELLVTITVDDSVLPGALDLLIEFNDGERYFVDSALIVTESAGGTTGDSTTEEPPGSAPEQGTVGCG